MRVLTALFLSVTLCYIFSVTNVYVKVFLNWEQYYYYTILITVMVLILIVILVIGYTVTVYL